jgi:hypothetical protein
MIAQFNPGFAAEGFILRRQEEEKRDAERTQVERENRYNLLAAVYAEIDSKLTNKLTCNCRVVRQNVYTNLMSRP